MVAVPERRSNRSALKIAITALISVGTYKIISRLLAILFDKIPLLKRYIFGPSYVEGTWIGRLRFETGSKNPGRAFHSKSWRIVIRGWAFNDDGSTYADWSSDTVTVDARTGNIRYTYDCDVMFKNTRQQGIAGLAGRGRAGDRGHHLSPPRPACRSSWSRTCPRTCSISR